MTTTTFIFLLPPQWNGEAGLRLVGIPPFGLLASRPTSPPQLPSPRLGLRERMSMSALPSPFSPRLLLGLGFQQGHSWHLHLRSERMHQYAFSTLQTRISKRDDREVGKGTLVSRVRERCGRRVGKNGDDGAEDLEALKGKERPLFATPRPTPPNLFRSPPTASDLEPRERTARQRVQARHPKKKGGRPLFFFSLLLRS